MSEIETLIQTLERQLPTTQVIVDPDQLEGYTVDGLIPRLVVLPGTPEEVAQVVALTNQQNLTIMARGSGSRMNLGSIPESIDVLIETRRLKRLLEHEAPDLTCQVEAGSTLAALQQQLAATGQRLAIDPPNAQQTTIGGLLASNASGPKRLRYGTARDLVIGLRVVQASGEMTHSGGRVVKNVAGYDLNKLYIGSLGTLGIIVEANFKLHPLPKAEQTLLLTFTNAVDAMHTVIDLLGSQLAPAALELIDSGAANDLNDFAGFHMPCDGYTLAVNFEGSGPAISRQIDETRLLARTHNALLGDELRGPDQTRFWEAVREHTQGTVTCKVAILVSQVAPYFAQIEQVCRRNDLEVATIVHAGNGILYIELRPGDATERVVKAITELRMHAQEAQGSLVVECCPADLKRRISVWGEPSNNFRMMQRLKQQFDAKGTFVKGRFVGGL